LESIIPLLPADFSVPVLVAQHMPSSFTPIFAQRMNSLSALEVIEVTRPTLLEPGKVYIAKGDADMVVAPRPTGLHVMSVPSDKSLWHPSVDRMVESALSHVPAKQLVGVLLTGMGDDGAKQMTRIKQGGGRTIAESEATSVVYGMPKALADLGGANLILDADQIAQQLLEWC
jgi:two-component system chemotaxis response regulator CheB